jgi:hypothetical protein
MTALPSINPVTRLTVELAVGGSLTVRGRDAWALNSLIENGAAGCTPIDCPAPRWSHYNFKLRGAGLNVETIDEAHGGAFSGTHARYVLRSTITGLQKIHKNDEPPRSRRGGSPSVVPSEPSEFDNAVAYEAAERAQRAAAKRPEQSIAGNAK